MDIISELWLHTICQYEPETVNAVADILGSLDSSKFASEAKKAGELKKAGMSDSFVKRVSDPKFLEEACETLEYCRKNRIRIIEWESDEYPVLLKQIKNPPRILFIKGEKIDLNSGLFVSMAGSRKATDQGRNAARQISKSMADRGICVVSGMAEGIDTEAHKGALVAGGKTIAVLAGSVDTIYPLSNKKLYFDILQNGCIISERPPGTVVKPYFYQQRNRIIVGISQGTVIVEGTIQSGTAITARFAGESNRDVFAVPGNPAILQSELPNSLIADGAIFVDRIDKPAEFYERKQPDFFEKKKEKEPKQNITIPGLSEEEQKIVNFIGDCGGVAGYEAVAAHCRITPGVLSSRLMGLCIRGILRQESGNRYVLVKILNYTQK